MGGPAVVASRTAPPLATPSPCAVPGALAQPRGPEQPQHALAACVAPGWPRSRVRNCVTRADERRGLPYLADQPKQLAVAEVRRRSWTQARAARAQRT